MPGHVATATVSPAKMRGKNLRFLPTSFPFHRRPFPFIFILTLSLSLSSFLATPPICIMEL